MSLEKLSIPHRAPERRIDRIMRDLAPEVVDHFSGVGSPIPECITGARVIDLGCGTGRDVFVAAALAGPGGFVMGLDTEQGPLEIARRNIESTIERFGWNVPNVAFRKGSIEKMRDAEIYDEDYDVAISNRALSLVPDRLKALKEIYRILKPGGEFHFADLFSDRRIAPEEGDANFGAVMYEGDFTRLARKAGFSDPRVLARRRVDAGEPHHAAFFAVTLRLFKIAEQETPEENYGQAATYLGTIEGCPHRFALDEDNLFETGRSLLVGGNTARILELSRFSSHFSVCGGQKRHFGPFAKQNPPKPRQGDE